MKVKNLKNRVLVFPNQGKLIVGSDLHGNRKDYLNLMEIFSREADLGKETYLLWLGDLIHGPQQLEDNFDYTDESAFILEHFLRMKKRFPEQLFSLLGNHEHGHVGGPHTSKFCEDEVRALASKTREKYWSYLSMLRSFPLLALTTSGVAFTHGAPSASVKSLQDVLDVSYSGHVDKEINEMYSVPVLDLLWMRGCSEETAKSFLQAVKYPDLENRLVVYGHDVVREGFERESRHSLVLSTSFGVEDRFKTYLEIDLSHSYKSTSDFKEGVELKNLYDLREEGDVSEFVRKAFDQRKFAAVIHNLRDIPDSPIKDRFLGGAYLGIREERDLEKAISHLESYLGYDCSSAETHLLLASAYEFKADEAEQAKVSRHYLERSISHLKEADTYNPGYHLLAQEAKERLRKKLKEVIKK
ncbi:MAG: metallophosphoesterase [Candidatus Woesearchaeota archaeon]